MVIVLVDEVMLFLENNHNQTSAQRLLKSPQNCWSFWVLIFGIKFKKMIQKWLFSKTFHSMEISRRTDQINKNTNLSRNHKKYCSSFIKIIIPQFISVLFSATLTFCLSVNIMSAKSLFVCMANTISQPDKLANLIIRHRTSFSLMDYFYIALLHWLSKHI